jgi:hypothetical protein
MIFLWANLSGADVEAYAASLVLPAYLSHLELAPVRFDQQPKNSDGREPLVLTYVGRGRLEEYPLSPGDHALPMILSVGEGIVASRICVPKDDAHWVWNADDNGSPMRIYFAPARPLLGSAASPAVASADDRQAYVSVSRGHVFIARPWVEAYVQAWLQRLGSPETVARFDFPTPSGEVEFLAGSVGGQMTLEGLEQAQDLAQFAGLGPALGAIREFAKPDLDANDQARCGIFEDGVYFPLTPGKRRKDEG